MYGGGFLFVLQLTVLGFWRTDRGPQDVGHILPPLDFLITFLIAAIHNKAPRELCQLFTCVLFPSLPTTQMSLDAGGGISATPPPSLISAPR